MTVAVTRDMSGLAVALKARGYTVVTYGEYPYPIDAMVYLGEGLDRITFTQGNLSGDYPGVFMVNATNKSIDEIDFTLKHRLYSSLF
ncbi:MAG: YkuS family protein [Eubacteriales bacterium]|nr:YkuS family protein [Eubacteriales bacterium]